MPYRTFLWVCAIGLLTSCAASTPQVRVVSCPTSVEARLQCRDQAFLLENGQEEAKAEALAQAAENYYECRKRHADLVKEVETCDRKLEALKSKLNK